MCLILMDPIATQGMFFSTVLVEGKAQAQLCKPLFCDI